MNKLKKHSFTKKCSDLGQNITYLSLFNCSSDLKNFANFWPSASNLKSYSQSLEHVFLIIGQNNFVTKYHCLALFIFMSFSLRAKICEDWEKIQNTKFKPGSFSRTPTCHCTFCPFRPTTPFWICNCSSCKTKQKY